MSTDNAVKAPEDNDAIAETQFCNLKIQDKGSADIFDVHETETNGNRELAASLMTIPDELRLLVLEHYVLNLFPRFWLTPIPKWKYLGSRGIWHFSFSEDRPPLQDRANYALPNEPGILRTCRQLRAETIQITATRRPFYCRAIPDTGGFRTFTPGLYTHVRGHDWHEYRKQVTSIMNADVKGSQRYMFPLWDKHFPNLKEVRIWRGPKRLEPAKGHRLVWNKASPRPWIEDFVTQLAQNALLHLYKQHGMHYVRPDPYIAPSQTSKPPPPHGLSTFGERQWKIVIEQEYWVSCRRRVSTSKCQRCYPTLFVTAVENDDYATCTVSIKYDRSFRDLENSGEAEWLQT